MPNIGIINPGTPEEKKYGKIDSEKIQKGESLEKVISTIFRGLETLHEELSKTQERVVTIEEKNIKHIRPSLN